MPSIEALETRIAPAGIFTYIDVDGDFVTVKTSKGTSQKLANLIVPNLSDEGVFNGKELQRINFSLDATFQGTDLSVTAIRGMEGGDGKVNVGFIDATFIDLGNISISGDLGRIVAGDASGNTAGVKSLKVGSIGRYGTDTQAGGGNNNSTITGALGSLTVAGDFTGGSLTVIGGMTSSDGTLGTVLIHGSLKGNSTPFSGFLSASGGMASVSIGHNVEGGLGAGSGQLFSSARIGSVKIGGSVIGGDGFHSGHLEAASFGSISIKGNLQGSSFASPMADNAPGSIKSAADITSIHIGGSILGGADTDSAGIDVGKNLHSLVVGGDIVGNGFKSGHVIVNGDLLNASIGGSVIGGFQAEKSGYIFALGIAKLRIGGDLVGGTDSVSSGKVAAFVIVQLDIGGSVIGGYDSDFTNGGQEAEESGMIKAEAVIHIHVHGSLIGRSGNHGGSVEVSSVLKKIAIDGSVIGGQGRGSGGIFSVLDMEAVSIGGDLHGADALNGTVSESGAVMGRHITSLTIGGSVIAGQKFAGASIERSGFISAGDDLGALVVKGSLIGNDTNPVLIVAAGQHLPPGTVDLAFGRISIGGRVESTSILAGYSITARGINADAQIGPVSVGGDWIASNLLAGINPAADGKVATADDIELHAGEDFGSGPVKDSNNITSRIAAIVIKGAVFGTPGVTTDSFGFGAQQIVSFTLGSVRLPLKAGVANDVFGNPGSALPLGAGRTGANTLDSFEVHVFEV